MSTLAEVLAQPDVRLVGDGALGTRFTELGVDPLRLPLLPLAEPDRVEAVHLEYLAAGARLLETHTFQANRIRLAALGLVADVYTLNRRAAQIARHARDTFGEPAWVIGSLGPLGQPVARGELPGVDPQEARAAYREQVAGLLAGGVDGFIVETMSDLGTVEAAVAAVRAESDLPVLVSFAFSVEGTTLYGLTPEEAAEGVLDLDGGPPALVGANCGTGPMPLLDAVLRMAPILRRRGVRLLAYPNAGQPTRRGDTVAYPATPAYMAAMVPALAAAGAAVVGGCCGTGPDHVRAMQAALAQGAAAPAPRLVAWRPEPPREAEGGYEDSDGQSRLAGLLRTGAFVVSVELDPPRGPNPRRLLDAARALGAYAVDAINVADSPMARVRMSALATAALVWRTTGIEPIVHFTTRDRNHMGIASDLLGAHALGLRNILCLTGDPPGLGDYAHATAVYDLDSPGLVRVLAAFNRGEDGLGHQLGQPTRFTIGVGVNPNAPDLGEEVTRLRRKLDAGAHFIMAQPLYEAFQLLRFLDRFGPVEVPLLVGIMPLVSHRQAEYLHHEVPGIDIPERIRRAMEQAGTDGVAVGVELALEFLHEVEGLVQGVYLVPSFNRIEPLAALLDALRVIKQKRRPS
ncbi:MAG: bifunctional homocysteine S-methyltransferase/methylenetetrahydrofolate reductase [Actinomycetia bacterium]|nr:bifunctional homocysteine S-methyltransferase/methylenetetrahydrofolate reductase [Actinomycetes bacterium]